MATSAPEDVAKEISEDRPIIEFSVDGDKVKLETKGKRTHVSNLVLNGESEETFGSYTTKNFTTLEGNVLTIKSKRPDGSSGRNRIFTFSDSGIELVTKEYIYVAFQVQSETDDITTI
ncbi:hypothetical protein NQ318_021320 [Aromia moschata]|uniref:Lipocalin/cytosolic fatty-acid binding domain-containing protein n=1 Tax=Aromia moschata TaxID=1265417 RepID=A0AAV8ZEE1_9CUCU|nr:hypothetical protein NQ318_021320 [Aromia moschata]